MSQSSPDFRALFESGPGLYLALTPDLKIVAVSEAYLQAIMTRREELLGRALFEIFPDNPNDPNATSLGNLRASLERVVQNKRPDSMPVQKHEIRRPESEGGGLEERFWSPINSPIFGADGAIDYIIHRVEDVTDFVRLQQKRMEEHKLAEEFRARAEPMEADLTRLTSQLAAANKELEAFSYSVSHDVRAPLRGINGFSRILEKDYKDKLDDEAKRLLGIVRGEAKRMDQMLEELLNLSRLGRQTMKSSTLDMTALAQEVFQDLAAREPGRKLHLQLQSLPTGLGDLPLMRHVFVNLFSNGIKFTRPREAAVIEVAGQTSAEQNTYYVRDNGVGFDSGQATKLFGAFQRMHAQKEFEGAGVGLAVVQRIIQRHGGTLWAEARVNEGATFYFTLPCA